MKLIDVVVLYLGLFCCVVFLIMFVGECMY